MRERVQTKVACTMDDTMIIQKKKKKSLGLNVSLRHRQYLCEIHERCSR